MAKRNTVKAEAEALVRSILKTAFQQKADDKTVKAVADKIAKGVPADGKQKAA